jgi:hypothetical protein
MRSNRMLTTNVKSLKCFWSLVCVLVLASNVWSMSHWNEARGVYDDVCYLRQAHLFQRFGLGGFDTDLARDDDRYLASKLKQIAYPGWNDPAQAPCHTPMPASGKLVLQYPPGTGLVLALFPMGHQVIPLYVMATLIVFGFAVLAIALARTPSAIALAGIFGCLAIYLMINPAKASYSIAPTMIVCSVTGYLTARWLTGQRHNLVLMALLGLLLGLSVNFRLPNLFLGAGYALFLLGVFLARRTRKTFAEGLSFGAAFVVGMAPTLIANAINAGNPLATTYSGADAVSPDFSLGIVMQYVTDMQFVLLALALASTAYMLRAGAGGVRSLGLVVALNLLVNLAFFLSHPIFTPYYTIPIAMLSLWTLLFGYLLQEREAVDERVVAQARPA